MSDSRCDEVIALTVDPGRDREAGRLATAVNAHFAMDVATRRRRAWTVALALLGLPATLNLVFPSLLPPALRRADAATWSLAALAWLSNLVFEIRSARTLQRLVAHGAGPGSGAGGRGKRSQGGAASGREVHGRAAILR